MFHISILGPGYRYLHEKVGRYLTLVCCGIMCSPGVIPESHKRLASLGAAPRLMYDVRASRRTVREEIRLVECLS